MTTVTIGYVPLLDAAPLIIAQEMGFAVEEGLSLTLRAAPSWSSVRDMLNFGAVNAAHMLSPVPITSAMGLGCRAAPMSVLSVLSNNGTVIGVANALADKMRGAGHDFAFNDVEAAGNALIAAADAPLRIGVPFPVFDAFGTVDLLAVRLWPACTPKHRCPHDPAVFDGRCDPYR